MQTFNQSGQHQQSDDTAGKKGIEVRVQKIKKESQSMHFFFQKVKALSDSLLIMLKFTHFLGAYLITGDLMFRGVKKNLR